jgi:hypothetical protein
MFPLFILGDKLQFDDIFGLENPETSNQASLHH